jgi:Co/Zn/Cd efflux system component
MLGVSCVEMEMQPGGSDELMSPERKRRERIATFAIGVLLLVLAVGSTAGAIYRLSQQQGPDDSVAGIVIASVSLAFMFFLWWFKVKASVVLDSRTLESDAACSFGCIAYVTLPTPCVAHPLLTSQPCC